MQVSRILKLIPLCAVLLLGCKFEPASRLNPAGSMIDRALSQSPSFISLKKHVTTPAYMVEEEGVDYYVIAIGESTLERFGRRGTLKIIKRSGAVFRLDTDSKGEEIWVLEYQPKSP